MTSITLESVAQKYHTSLQRVFDVTERACDVHPLLAQPCPIALVEEDTFFIFDVSSPQGPYRPVKQTPMPVPVPPGVRAAFPLDAYDGRSVCVVTGDVFDSLDGYATLLHEFVHCHQWHTVEPVLRERLKIARDAKARNDPMWEINHPFPYADTDFVETYSAFLDAGQAKDLSVALSRLSQFKDIFRTEDNEYLTWQMWKEGLARWVENGVRRRLGLDENHGGGKVPFSRVSFYEGGARLIEMLNAKEPQIVYDLGRLFERMADPQG